MSETREVASHSALSADLARALEELVQMGVVERIYDREGTVRYQRVESASPSRCPICSNVGRRTDGRYCSCAMGRDLERVETRKFKAPEFGAGGSEE